MMKQYLRADENHNIVDVGIIEALGDAVMDIVDSGIDEDAHFWGSNWREIDDDDFEAVMKDPALQEQLFERVKSRILESLKQVLELRQEESARWTDNQEDKTNPEHHNQ